VKKLYLIILSFLFLVAKEENNDFFKVLNEVNEIAFVAKLNLDKVPSNFTVLKRDFIIKSGAKTLFDLLKFVPGIQTSINSLGKKEVIVRGNKFTYRDKIKFLINGISVTNNLYANQDYYYNFPASLIKRVEIILTPDSVMYGDKAFLGIINVVTLDKLNDNLVYAYGSNQKEFSFVLFKKDSNFLIDYYYQVSDPHFSKEKVLLADITSAKVNFYRYAFPNRFERNIGLGIRYKKGHSQISYRINYEKRGNFFGIVNMIPLKEDKHIKSLHQYLDYSFSSFLNDFWKNSFRLGVKNYKWKGEFRSFPYDFNETIDNNPNNDLILGASISEIEFYLKNILKFMNNSHITNYVFVMKYAKPYDVYYLQYVPSLNDKKKLTGKNNILKSGIYRRVLEIGFEDLYFLNEKVSFVYGLRFSHYSDFGDNVSYKVGGIYTKDDFNTFKLLFNTAFRAPSWIELYAHTAASFNGNENLKAEKIKMGEFIYLHNFSHNLKSKFSYYLGREKNFIGRVFSTQEGKKIYQNLGDFLIRGFEFSLKRNFSKGYWNISYSFNDNKALFSVPIRDINFYKYLGIRKRFVKAYTLYKIDNNWNLFISGFYGSKIKTPKYISDVKPYFSLNTNLFYQRGNLGVKIGVDNLTNHKNYELAIPNDIIYNKYMFLQPDSRITNLGRRIYISLIKKW